LIVLYDAKNNKKSPADPTSLPREAGQERSRVPHGNARPAAAASPGCVVTGTSAASRTDFHHQKGVLP
jgi:hypothetical protein